MASLGEWGDRARHCSVGTQSEGEKGGQHTRLGVISAWRPARASALPVLGAFSRSPKAWLMTHKEAERTGVSGGLQEGTGGKAGAVGGLRGTSVHTAPASSSSEAEAARFAPCLDGSKVGARSPCRVGGTTWSRLSPGAGSGPSSGDPWGVSADLQGMRPLSFYQAWVFEHFLEHFLLTAYTRPGARHRENRSLPLEPSDAVKTCPACRKGPVKVKGIPLAVFGAG